MFSSIVRRAFSMTTAHQQRSLARVLASKKPLILIVGATGTGKSDLAIQLAQSLSRTSWNDSENVFTGAEIINADAMQLYRGLPIITNKVPLAEQQGIPHHLLDHIGLEEEPWTVQKYVKEADRVIEEVRGRGKVPIVVGGTSYYVYGLLFKNATVEDAHVDGSDMDEISADVKQEAAQTWPILEASTQEIYAKLQEVDPEQASRWHPNDRRKIQRSLEIYLRSGRKASDIYEDQKRKTLQSPLGMTHSGSENEKPDEEYHDLLRYNPIVLWLEAEGPQFKDRLNHRVDRMVESGLLSEALEMDGFLRKFERMQGAPDKTKGIWVSIGYKEMEPWIEACRGSEVSKHKLDSLKSLGIEAVKTGTRQYAKRQNRFVRIRLANALSKAQVEQKLFLLDCTDTAKWQSKVQQPALDIVSTFLQGGELPDPFGLSPLAKSILTTMRDEEQSSKRVAKRCETCDKVLMTEREWTVHINSRSHKKILESIHRRDNNGVRKKASQTESDADVG